MIDAGWQIVPLSVRADERHGGRWVSLCTPRRQWLWTNPDQAVAGARGAVEPGDPFVDAGGVEECIPTVRGLPDHGDAWSRVWIDHGVAIPSIGRLSRRFEAEPGTLCVHYLVEGTPGEPFLHAVHALLDVSGAARLLVPGVSSALVLDPSPQVVAWPSGLDALGPVDGTATCALLPGCREAIVVDGDDALRLTWSAPGADGLCSLLLWRNLGGWPGAAPYRSIGVEPMVGRTAQLGGADPADCAAIGPDGRFAWELRLSAYQRREPAPL